MKYEKARNLVFDCLLKEKELNKVNKTIEYYERNMPYDSGAASEYLMSLMDVEIEKRDELEKEIKLMKDEIEILLKVFT